MGEIAERWKIEAVLTLVRQVEVCNFFIAGQHIPAGKTRLFLEKLSFDECDVLGIVQGLEVEDYSEGPLADDKGRCRDLGFSEPMSKHLKRISSWRFTLLGKR